MSRDGGAPFGRPKRAASFAAASRIPPVFFLAIALGLADATAQAAAPQNDSCPQAVSIATLPYADATTTTAATSDPADPVPNCGNGSRAESVWYRFTAPGPGTITADTLGSAYDTILSVYTGDCSELTPSPDGCNDDDPRGGAESRLVLLAEGGTTYLFMVSAYDADGGSLLFHLRFQHATVCVGDCDGDGALSQTECDACELISTGEPLQLCPPCDGNGDGGVGVEEVNLCRLGMQGCVQCRGDCDGNGRVTAADLVTAVSLILHCPCDGDRGGIAVGCPALPEAVTECRAADRDGDGCVAAEEIDALLSNVYRCGR